MGKKLKHEILCDLKRVAVKLKKTPSRAEYRKHGQLSDYTIANVFGGWVLATQAAGLPPLVEKPPPVELREPKILLWDIEASDLAANFGFTFCIGYKWMGEKKVHLVSIRDFKSAFAEDPTNDLHVVAHFSDVLAQADYHVTWYGARFDLPFLQTRSIELGLPPLPDRPHVDAWRIAKYKLRFNSNRLETVSRSIAIAPGAKQSFKTPIDAKCWVKAKAGHVDSIKYIEEHCVADVDVLENVFQKIRPYASSLPNLSKLNNPLIEGCPACGSSKMNKKGKRITPRGWKQQLQCQDCAHWYLIPIGRSAS